MFCPITEPCEEFQTGFDRLDGAVFVGGRKWHQGNGGGAVVYNWPVTALAMSFQVI